MWKKITRKILFSKIQPHDWIGISKDKNSNESFGLSNLFKEETCKQKGHNEGNKLLHNLINKILNFKFYQKGVKRKLLTEIHSPWYGTPISS